MAFIEFENVESVKNVLSESNTYSLGEKQLGVEERRQIPQTRPRPNSAIARGGGRGRGRGGIARGQNKGQDTNAVTSAPNESTQPIESTTENN